MHRDAAAEADELPPPPKRARPAEAAAASALPSKREASPRPAPPAEFFGASLPPDVLLEQPPPGWMVRRYLRFTRPLMMRHPLPPLPSVSSTKPCRRIAAACAPSTRRRGGPTRTACGRCAVLVGTLLPDFPHTSKKHHFPEPDLRHPPGVPDRGPRHGHHGARAGVIPGFRPREWEPRRAARTVFRGLPRGNFCGAPQRPAGRAAGAAGGAGVAQLPVHPTKHRVELVSGVHADGARVGRPQNHGTRRRVWPAVRAGRGRGGVSCERDARRAHRRLHIRLHGACAARCCVCVVCVSPR